MKHTGWNRSLRTWLATAATPAERSVWRDGLRMKEFGTRLSMEEIVPMAKGVSGIGKWWGDRKGRER